MLEISQFLVRGRSISMAKRHSAESTTPGRPPVEDDLEVAFGKLLWLSTAQYDDVREKLLVDQPATSYGSLPAAQLQDMLDVVQLYGLPIKTVSALLALRQYMTKASLQPVDRLVAGFDEIN